MRETRQTPSELILDVMLLLFEEPRGSGDLSDAVADLRGRPVALATFFRQLQRAVDRGWIAIEEPDAGSALPTTPPSSSGRSGHRLRREPGRPGRLYRLSPSGERLLRSGVEQQRRRLRIAEALGLTSSD